MNILYTGLYFNPVTREPEFVASCVERRAARSECQGHQTGTKPAQLAFFWQMWERRMGVLALLKCRENAGPKCLEDKAYRWNRSIRVAPDSSLK
jgi:hypothetical protein